MGGNSQSRQRSPFAWEACCPSYMKNAAEMDKAKYYFNEGKALHARREFAKAKEAYDMSIQLNPDYELAHYNRRIAAEKAERKSENIPPQENLYIQFPFQEMNSDGEFSSASFKEKQDVPSSSTYFVISTIARVSKDEFSSDSSDEELDGTFPDEMFKFRDMPFTTTRPQFKGAKFKRPKLEKDFKSNFEDISNQLRDSISQQRNSIVVAPLLQKLSENGFEKNDRDKLKSVSISIGLNRMKSLSTRKNNLLVSELENKVETSVNHKKFAFYWECDWYTKTGEVVEYERVRKFYKQLKRIDSKKAKRFREILEKDVPVPYQKLREYAKNHSKTKELVQEFRKKNPGANVYLSLIDSDTIDFNGIYSAYLRIVANCSEIPTVMTTGYMFPQVDKDEGGKSYQFCFCVDRMIRVKTARHLPLGVYYPEPNMCILIPAENDTLPESFIYEDKKRESACLLRNLREKRKNPTFIFSEDKPLITSIPARAKLTKSHKKPIPFSSEFKEGASPTDDDFKKCKQISQSHSHEKVWYDSLFINGAITFKKGDAKHASQKCKHLFAKIRNFKETTDRDESIHALREYLDDDVVNAIIAAATEVTEYVIEQKNKYVRSGDEDKFLNILRGRNIRVEDVATNREKYLTLIQPNVIQWIENEKIDPRKLIGLDIEALEYICDYGSEIIDIVKRNNIEFDTVLSLLNEENLQYYISAIENNSFLDVLEKYQEDPRHIKEMASMEEEDNCEEKDNCEEEDNFVEEDNCEEESTYR